MQHASFICRQVKKLRLVLIWIIKANSFLSDFLRILRYFDIPLRTFFCAEIFEIMGLDTKDTWRKQLRNGSGIGNWVSHRIGISDTTHHTTQMVAGKESQKWFRPELLWDFGEPHLGMDVSGTCLGGELKEYFTRNVVARHVLLACSYGYDCGFKGIS